MYFVNENTDISVVGALEYFKSKEEMLLKIEPWYEDVPHIVFDLNGNCFQIIGLDYRTSDLKKVSKRVDISTVEECINYVDSGYQIDKYPDTIKFV